MEVSDTQAPVMSTLVSGDGARRERAAHIPPSERVARGKAARTEVPRESHAEWKPAPGRSDPIDLLQEQDATRLRELVPIRYGRMVASPFAFFRGAAYPMAADLAPTPRSGIRVQLCGDAHLSNFGGFASPERELLFDLNDFDETLPGPWEWDVKRLAASVAVAGRERGFSRRQRRDILRATVRTYREAMRRFAKTTNLDVWYAHLSDTLIQEQMEKYANAPAKRGFQKATDKALSKDRMRAFNKLTREVDGEWRIVSDPPLIVPIEQLIPVDKAAEYTDSLRRIARAYSDTLQGDRRHLLGSYRLADIAFKVVGVGSVGTRTWIVFAIADGKKLDPLFLQLKEAGPSVLEPFAGASKFRNHARRVVEGQRLMQSASDILLGWVHATGLEDQPRDFYVRQLWDWKSSADIEAMVPDGMMTYGRMCGWTLARAHARSGDRIAIAAYLGGGSAFDRALAEFAEAYADQNERDHGELVEAVKRGRIVAQTGL